MTGSHSLTGVPRHHNAHPSTRLQPWGAVVQRLQPQGRGRDRGLQPVVVGGHQHEADRAVIGVRVCTADRIGGTRTLGKESCTQVQVVGIHRQHVQQDPGRHAGMYFTRGTPVQPGSSHIPSSVGKQRCDFMRVTYPGDFRSKSCGLVRPNVHSQAGRPKASARSSINRGGTQRWRRWH